MGRVGRTSGGRPLRVGGFELRDNTSALTLPDIELPAGGSIVVAAVEADVGDAVAVRLEGGLFNGLANAGDRVLLLTAEGAVVDALSYGDDSSRYGPPLVAPGPGQPLRRRFEANGALAGIEVGPAGAAVDGDRDVEATAAPTEPAPTAPAAVEPSAPATAVPTEAPPSAGRGHARRDRNAGRAGPGCVERRR